MGAGKAELTEQELALQRKYAEARLKREQRLKKQKAEQTAGSAGKAEGDTAGNTGKVALGGRLDATRQADGGAASSVQAKPEDPMARAKRALLEAQKKKEVAAARQKAGAKLRPPSNRRVQPKDGKASSGIQQTRKAPETVTPEGRAENKSEPKRPAPLSWEEREVKRIRTERDNLKQKYEEESKDDTLFVGDLPPYYTEQQVKDVFMDFGPVAEVRIMGSQCYAFVKFKHPEVAQSILDRFRSRPLIASGHELRINNAYGKLPEWKRGPAVARSRQQEETIEAYQHPKVAAARQHGDAIAQRLLLQQMTQKHGVNFNPPPERELVTYDDL